MKTKLYLYMAAAGLCGSLHAADDVEALREELRQLKARTEQLEQRLGALGSATNTTSAGSAVEQSADPRANIPRADGSYPSIPGSGMALVRAGNSYLDLSLNGLFAAGTSTADDIGALQIGGHDPNQRGFSVQSIEATFTGAVDPYFRGLAAIDFHLDAEGETAVEAEEAYLETVSLPANLQIRAGQFYTDFGRHNTTHAHAWAFVDSPLVNARFLGPDGLRNPGARLSWLAPLPFFTELSVSVQNSHGETGHSFRNEHEGEAYLGRLHSQRRVEAFDDMLIAPRLATSFDIADSQVVLAGLSGAFGPNASGSDTRTEIYGADVYWKWKSLEHNGGFPFVSWQTEAMLRRYQASAFNEDLDGSGTLDAGEPDLDGDSVADFAAGERLTDYGFYTQMQYGFRKGWIAGLRFDYVTPDGFGNYESASVFDRDPDRARRWRVSPNLTWLPSEFSKVRLQYNYDDRRGIGVDHSVWLQFEFLLGSHGAHKF